MAIDRDDPWVAPSKRVLSLTDPSQKMSKSAPNPNSRILITDPPEVIVKKIRGAVTDSERTLSWDPEERRGVSNLLRILDACQGRQGQDQGVDAAPTPPADQEQDLANETPDDHAIRMSNLTSRLSAEGISSHAQLKSLVSESIIEKLRGIREEYLRVRGDEAYLSSVAQEGRERARELAGRTMGEVRRKVGLSSI
jgi:tryptophanyl-tRNA synthetase